MSDKSTETNPIHAHRTPVGVRTEPGQASTYRVAPNRSRGGSFATLAVAGVFVVLLILGALYVFGPETGDSIGSGGTAATDSAVTPDDPIAVPAEPESITTDTAN